MSERRTAILLAGTAALVAWIWLGGAPAPESAPHAAPLLAAAPDTVARVELRERDRRIVAVRNGTGWVDEWGARWRDDAPSSLIATLGLAPLMVVATDPADPAEFGLDAAAPHLELAGTDGAALLALEVGARNPSATGLYARLAGRRDVVLLGAVLAWELDKLRAAAPARP